MKILKTIDECERFRESHSYKNVGFVPTMGALHDGHLSLIQTSQRQCDITIASIFVNPSQFGPNEDLSTYPRTLDTDLEKCTQIELDALFIPTTQMIYPANHFTEISVPYFSTLYCGKTRPDFFKGVTTVCMRLLNLIQPQLMFMGEKDFQQLQIVKKMIKDCFLPVQVIGCPIIREASGLALSSRNQYLSKNEAIDAAQLFQALSLTKKAFQDGVSHSSELESICCSFLQSSSLTVEYCAIINEQTLEPITDKVKRGNRLLIAVHLNATRLIDNVAF